MIGKIEIGSPIKNVKKGWGEEIWIANSEDYCGKILRFNAGAEFSYHYHMNKSETFYVLEGIANLEYFDLSTGDEKSFTLIPGIVVDIPKGNPHKITASTEVRIIEISTHHEDSDSYRIGKGDSQRDE